MAPPFNQLFPPAPAFTERQLGSLTGKVVLITGATSGIGLELAKMVYGNGASVYITGRSEAKLSRAVKDIQAAISSRATGGVDGLTLDLEDLAGIKDFVHGFLKKENRLDVLVHNAGLMTPPAGSKSRLGYDLEMATNCLGPFLLNQQLEGVLKSTAAQQSADQPNNVRVVWLSSMVAVGTHQNGIVFDENTGAPKVLKNAMENYMESKVGNLFLASETAKSWEKDGIISVSINPGVVKTELQRHGPLVQRAIIGTIFKPARYAAYTELFAGFSPQVTAEHNGAFIIPWGRFGQIPDDIARGLKSKSEGGTGLAKRFRAWCEEETRQYT
ncbi:MAG: hypothetical protein Q9227_005606 [Pyrenula ochraceoflavens]